jgi:hypothetical protein
MSKSVFEEVARVLDDLDIERSWTAATDLGRRVLVESVAVLLEHLEVTVSGAPRLHVLYQEVGLKEAGLIVSEVRVQPQAHRLSGAWSGWTEAIPRLPCLHLVRVALLSDRNTAGPEVRCPCEGILRTRGPS